VNRGLISDDEVIGFLEQHRTPLEEESLIRLETQVRYSFPGRIPEASPEFFNVGTLLTICKLRHHISHDLIPADHLENMLEQYRMLTFVLDFVMWTGCYDPEGEME